MRSLTLFFNFRTGMRSPACAERRSAGGTRRPARARARRASTAAPARSEAHRRARSARTSRRRGAALAAVNSSVAVGEASTRTRSTAQTGPARRDATADRVAGREPLALELELRPPDSLGDHHRSIPSVGTFTGNSDPRADGATERSSPGTPRPDRLPPRGSAREGDPDARHEPVRLRHRQVPQGAAKSLAPTLRNGLPLGALNPPGIQF